MDLLLLLLTAHFIGDFYLQPTRWVNCRNKNHLKSPSLWKHLIVHTLLYTAVFLIMASSSFGQAAVSVAVISASHLLTDYGKSYLKNTLTTFLLDQVIHILVIVAVWATLAGFSLIEIKALMTNITTANNAVLVIAYLLVCKPASVIISLALKKHTDELKKQSGDHTQHAAVEVTGTPDDKITVTFTPQQTQKQPLENSQRVGLISAGAWIGYIERSLTISFIFMGQFTGIGFLVATKTIFRFGDLTKNKDMKLTEYMMLGTFLSYAIAIFVGWAALKLYQTL